MLKEFFKKLSLSGGSCKLVVGNSSLTIGIWPVCWELEWTRAKMKELFSVSCEVEKWGVILRLWMIRNIGWVGWSPGSGVGISDERFLFSYHQYSFRKSVMSLVRPNRKWRISCYPGSHKQWAHDRLNAKQNEGKESPYFRRQGLGIELNAGFWAVFPWLGLGP